MGTPNRQSISLLRMNSISVREARCHRNRNNLRRRNYTFNVHSHLNSNALRYTVLIRTTIPCANNINQQQQQQQSENRRKKIKWFFQIVQFSPPNNKTNWIEKHTTTAFPLPFFWLLACKIYYSASFFVQFSSALYFFFLFFWKTKITCLIWKNKIYNEVRRMKWKKASNDTYT